MTDVTSTPTALRWVALFLAACAVLGLFLGFRDQIRKNPPDWFTGAAASATLLPAAPDGAREATAFDPNAPIMSATTSAPAPAKAEPGAKTDAPAAGAEPVTDTPAPKTIAPPVLTPSTAPSSPPAAAPRARPVQKAAPTPAPTDPVGDILESQKQPEAPAAVPY